MVNKDTSLYGSFSSNPGNNGCLFFNNLFKKNNINAIYKSFYSDNLKQSINSAKNLNFKGFALSMPFKIEILKYLDECEEAVNVIGACNTVKIHNNKLKGFNTDWVGAYKYLKNLDVKSLTILGNGGFSKAVQYACNILNITVNIIERDQWGLVPQLKGIIFNCTPVEVYTEGLLIDGRPSTPKGKEIALLQAKEQYKIYINEIS